MKTMTLITPINCKKIRNLSVNNYLLLYLDEKNNLKRAIPDFDEQFISSEESLINEAMNSEKIAVFKIIKKRECCNSPVFCIFTDNNGEVIEHNNYNDTAKLDSFLLDTKKRKTVSKLLKKRR